MRYLLLGVISCLCLLRTGLSVEECSQDVLATRETIDVPAGGSQSLSCVVQHCGYSWKAVTSQRTVLHRVLVCASASLCLPIILGLAYCLSSKVKPQTLPRTLSTHAAVYTDQPHPAPQPPPRCPVPQKHSKSPRKAAPKSRQKTEVVYADISQDALRQGATRAPDQSTVYSSLRFS
ncbi:uncharacterized protein LOC117259380 isoform X2 [Epinephelus lanceolatus]|uniref:uncharacterized protein si:dkey-52l18.4 isoform X2 n=1 Tax=Epinephelus lanceolatus TaxID=310571 RepID=UPI0014466875|nr:uncharacterized protein si:dkey-52l18.4 isoform X2 [Epinephelus lanceolatus]